MDVLLSKKQIDILCSFPFVNCIESINMIEEPIGDDFFDVLPTDNTDNNTNRDGYDTSFYAASGINVTRDAFGLNGNGMRVGMVELEYLPDPSLISTRTMYDVTPFSHHTTYCSHATTVAKLMVGYKDGYIGAIPLADLYYSCMYTFQTTYFESRAKSAVESLIDNNVTAINCSFGWRFDVNSYGSLAKWYDHVAIQHNVHIIIAAGNMVNDPESVTEFGIGNTNMSYNGIVVGNCYNDGSIFRDPNTNYTASSYCPNSPNPYKPDLVAPGTNIDIIPDYYPPGTPAHTAGLIPSGTSFSAPIVTSAVIQLSQASALLMTNPILMKSLLISSSKITNGMSGEPVLSTTISDDIAYSRPYGSGMLYVPNAYDSFIDRSYFYSGIMSSTTESVSASIRLKSASSKTIRFCLTWQKNSTVDDNNHQGNATITDLDQIRLTVTTPNGVTYSSAYETDNKQMISFQTDNGTGHNGYYFISIERMNSAPSNIPLSFAVTASIQN